MFSSRSSHLLFGTILKEYSSHKKQHKVVEKENEGLRGQEINAYERKHTMSWVESIGSTVKCWLAIYPHIVADCRLQIEIGDHCKRLGDLQ